MDATTIQMVAARIVREVAELPDRGSPEDNPNMMLVEDNELRLIVIAVLTDYSDTGE